MKILKVMEQLQDGGSGYQSFTELKAWQAARVVKLVVQELTRDFPETEKFRLNNQIIRSSRSVGNNIAEGHGRRTPKEALHFCTQARGSLSETLGHMIDALDAAYISETQLNDFKIKFQNAEALLDGYIKFLRGKL